VTASLRVWIIAGEPSGDRLGAALMAGLQDLSPHVRIEGIGGVEMTALGLDSLFPMQELSVMGLTEVLPRLPALLARVRDCAAAIARTAPDVLITIDSPDFCLRVAAKAKAARPDLPTVHYVAPSVWAWREHRADKMARSIDHVLALLPFEPPYMERAGMSCDFVGHPVATEPVADAAAIATFRRDYGLGHAPLVLVLPGSRASEVARLAPIFGEALRPVIAAHPTARVIVPTVAGVADAMRAATVRWPVVPVILDPRGQKVAVALATKRAAFGAAEVALAASGTVSLELAAAATPMVIAYDMNWISRVLIARALKIDTVTLVNLVSETRAVPEFLGAACKPAEIGAALVDLMGNSAARAAQDQDASLTMARLGRGAQPPGLRAAASVLALLDRRKP
jgi:lipid-A-disaccharide synthase